MTLPRFAVGQCGCMDEEYQCSRKTVNFILMSAVYGYFFKKNNVYLRFGERHTSKSSE